jgi:hypothetical protein
MASSNALTGADVVFCAVDPANGAVVGFGSVTLVPDANGLAAGTVAITAATTAGGTMTMSCTDATGQAPNVNEVSMTAIPVSTLQASGLAARSGRHAPPLPAVGRAPWAAHNRRATPSPSPLTAG